MPPYRRMLTTISGQDRLPSNPLRRIAFTTTRRWFWDYGNGDLGNQGIHQVDVARWGLRWGFPNKISATGGHFMFDGDQQTPNTLNCAFEYDLADGQPRMLQFEVRHWIANHEAGIVVSHDPAASPNDARPKLGPLAGTTNTVGNVFYGSNGYLAVDSAGGYNSWMGKDQQPGLSEAGSEDNHFANFIACVMSRTKEELHAPIEEGHISSGFVHLANASRTLVFDPETELVKNDDDDAANELLRDCDRGYRSPFVVPEHV
jgi:hypothetical protein